MAAACHAWVLHKPLPLSNFVGGVESLTMDDELAHLQRGSACQVLKRRALACQWLGMHVMGVKSVRAI